MEYEKDLVHNVLTAARNTIVSVVKKVEDNILHMMNALDVMPPSTALKTPEASLLGVLPKVPNALVIK